VAIKMPSDSPGLVKALLASPGDVTARLALADCFEEEGEDRFARPLRCGGWWISEWYKEIGRYYLYWHVHSGHYTGGRTGVYVAEVRRKEAPRCEGITVFHGRKVTLRTPGPCLVLNHLIASAQTRWLWLCQNCRDGLSFPGSVE